MSFKERLQFILTQSIDFSAKKFIISIKYGIQEGNMPWLFWIILAVFFFVLEIFTAGFFVFWFGIGAALAFVALKLGVTSAVWQWAIFVISSSILAFFSRRFANKISKGENVKVAGEQMVGRNGIIIEVLDGAYMAKFQTETWRCLPEKDGDTFQIGDKIVSTELSGTHLKIKKEV